MPELPYIKLLSLLGIVILFDIIARYISKRKQKKLKE